MPPTFEEVVVASARELRADCTVGEQGNPFCIQPLFGRGKIDAQRRTTDGSECVALYVLPSVLQCIAPQCRFVRTVSPVTAQLYNTILDQ